jgi:hypothetical protein
MEDEPLENMRPYTREHNKRVNLTGLAFIPERTTYVEGGSGC